MRLWFGPAQAAVRCAPLPAAAPSPFVVGHRVTHRDWCAYCVRARGLARKHMKADEEAEQEPSRENELADLVRAAQADPENLSEATREMMERAR